MKQYIDLVNHVLDNGFKKNDRTGTGTISVFGYQMRFDLNEGFPMVTTKKLHLKSIIYELLWFLKGDTNINYLAENGVRIWNEWANENGDLGPVYGHQWRNWNDDEIDQIKDIIKTLKTNPDSRRMLVSAWNPSVLPDTSKSFSENIANGKAALPPCHAFFQFYVADGKHEFNEVPKSGEKVTSLKGPVLEVAHSHSFKKEDITGKNLVLIHFIFHF